MTMVALMLGDVRATSAVVAGVGLAEATEAGDKPNVVGPSGTTPLGADITIEPADSTPSAAGCRPQAVANMTVRLTTLPSTEGWAIVTGPTTPPYHPDFFFGPAPGPPADPAPAQLDDKAYLTQTDGGGTSAVRPSGQASGQLDSQ